MRSARHNVTIGGFYGAPLRLPLSWLVQNAYEPDGDNIVLSESALQVMPADPMKFYLFSYP
jgi:hypothetical protein